MVTIYLIAIKPGSVTSEREGEREREQKQGMSIIRIMDDVS